MRYVTFLFLALVMTGIFAGEGKVFIKTEPPGADIFLSGSDNKETPLNAKTFALVQVLQGEQCFVLRLDGYKPALLRVNVGSSIMKPDVVVLERLLYNIDVIFQEDGWQVFVDKKAVNDTAGHSAVTPCTVKMAAGQHEVLLAKAGFLDIVQKHDVKENGSVTVSGRAVKGTSVILKTAPTAEKKDEPFDGKLPAGYSPGWILAKYLASGQEIDIYHNDAVVSQMPNDQFVFHGVIIVPPGKKVVRVRKTQVVEWGSDRYKATVNGASAAGRPKPDYSVLIKIKDANDKYPSIVDLKWAWNKADCPIVCQFEWIFDEKAELGWSLVPKEAMAHTPAIKAKYEKK